MNYTVFAISKGCNSFMKNRVGITIKSKRKEYELTQEELAEKAGVTPSYIGQIERGKTYPSFEVLARITTMLSIDANSYFSDDVNQNKERKEFYLLYDQLPPKMKKLAKEMLRLLSRTDKK